MSRPAFDTLKYAQSLEESGIDRKQAEAFAKAQKESLKELMEETLATKEDLREVKSELKEEISKLREEMKDIHISLIKWMIGLMSVWSAILSSVMTALKFLH